MSCAQSNFGELGIIVCYSETGSEARDQGHGQMASKVAAAGLTAAVLLWNCSSIAQAQERDLEFFLKGDAPARVELSSGVFAPFDNGSHDRTADFQFDAISRWNIVNFWNYFEVRPYLGGFVTGKGGHMGYVGIYGTAPLGQQFEVNPFLAIGAYGRGNGRDLGSTALFQTGLSGFYVFESGYRAGITFAHESNGSILPHNHSNCTCNPGANNFLLTLAIPID